MYSFVISTQPRSYNSKKTVDYQRRIKLVFEENYPSHTLLTTELYGLVYHFFKQDIGIDADNLSKPIWDGLQGVIFVNDNQIKMRVAGSFDLAINDITTLNLTGLTGTVSTSLLAAIENEQHVLYVECGNFITDMIRLNLERNGN